MGRIARADFSEGWNPSVDKFKCPPNALLRMDNLVLDELGAVALRQGSAHLGAQYNNSDVHTIFTALQGGSTKIMYGITDSVYANGIEIDTGLTGSGDTSFGSHMGQILYARGTTKKKYDGSSVLTTWGIAPPIAAPAVAALTADSKTFATCSSTESPGMTSNEGTQTFQTDRAGTANAAVQIVPDATTGRGTSTLTYAAPTNFTTYSGGDTGTDDDLLDFYAYITEPQYIASITLMVDVNDGTFELDWYDYTFLPGEAIEVTQDSNESLASDYTVEGYARDLVRSRLEDEEQFEPVTTFRADKPSGGAGWNHFSIARGKMLRHGLTTGNNWSTVKAVRVTFTASAGGSSAAMRFDEISILGGSARPLTGKFKAAIVAVRNDGTYQALSGPSPFSAEIELKAQGLRAQVNDVTIAALDPQVNELWLYLFGGGTNGFYRFATYVGGHIGAPFINIDATSSVRTALIANIRMQTDNTTPPDSIIGIEGPHFDRTLCLTASKVYPSRQLNPDGYSQGEVITVGDSTETALWIKKLGEGGLFVGTTKDIYRLDGDFTTQTDGTINVSKRSMGVSHPPISAAVAVGEINGLHTLIYLSGDGWRQLGGGSLVDNAISLLWHGYARHDVSYVNITDPSSRFRIAITKNQLTAITPEYPSTTASSVLHRYDFTKQRWYRFTYPSSFRSIHAEKNGILLAGDNNGYIHVLNYPTGTDNGTAIPVVLWTGADDNGEPFSYKDGENLSIRAWTDSTNATVDVCLNGASSANQTYTTAQTEVSPDVISLTALAQFTQHQLRVSGSFTSFIFRGYELNYLDGPPPYVLHDTGFIDLGLFSWVRKIRVKARAGSNFTVTPYFDGTAYTPTTVTPRNGVAYVYDVPMGREAKGRAVRGIVTSDDPTQVYWMEFEYNDSGRTRQKRIERFAGIA